MGLIGSLDHFLLLSHLLILFQTVLETSSESLESFSNLDDDRFFEKIEHGQNLNVEILLLNHLNQNSSIVYENTIDFIVYTNY